MKVNTTISLDIDVLIEAKRELNNISGEINKYLMYRLGLNKDNENKNSEQIEAERDIKIAEAQRLNQSLEKLKKHEKAEADKNQVLYSFDDGK